MHTEDKALTAINSVLFIVNKLGGKARFHKVFKILYFAEMEHLKRYGRMFSQDKYIKMQYGPVPDYIYSALKKLRNNSSDFDHIDLFLSNLRVVENDTIVSKNSADLDELSLSEIEVLTESIQKNKDLSFQQLTHKSHGTAWQSTIPQDRISTKAIAEELGMNESMTQYALETEELHNTPLS